MKHSNKILLKILALPIFLILFFTFIKPSVTTLYCLNTIPQNEIESKDYLTTCLHTSYLDGHSKRFLNLLDRIPNKSISVMDFLYNENIQQNNYERANYYLKQWKDKDHKNGTFDYFGVEASILEYPEKENISLQKDLLEYKHLNKNKKISVLVNRYENFLEYNKNEQFYKDSMIFASQF